MSQRAFRRFVVPIVVLLAALPAAARQNISNSSLTSWGPRVAVGPGGTLHVAWMECYSETSGDCYYSMSASGTTWTTPINLSQCRSVRDDGHRGVDLDVDDNGRVYVVWAQGSSLRMRTSTGGQWDDGFVVAEYGASIEAPNIVCDGSGNLYIAWETGNGYVCSRARVNGNWEPVRWISRSGTMSKNPAIAIGKGQVFASWSDKGGGEYKLRFSQRSASYGATWATSSAIPGTNYSLEDQYSAVEADNDDRGHFVWAYYLGGNRRLVCAHGAMGRFSGVEGVSSEELLHYPRACEVNGIVIVAWQTGGWGSGQCIKYNAYNGSWGGIGTVPESGGCTYIDVDATSDGKTAWFVWDGAGDIWIGSAPVQGGGGGGDNKKPVASFSFTPQQGDAPLVVSFDASASYDPDGKISTFSWDFGDGKSGRGAVINHRYVEQGDFTAGLTVTDNDGQWASKFVTVRILDANKAPTARFSYTPHAGEYPLKVAFDASASSDPDGSIASYTWDFGDGSSGKGRLASHTFTTARTFEVRLTVADNKGKEDTQFHPVEVVKPNKPPVARFSYTPHGGEYPLEVAFDASESADPDGSIASYTWDFGDGASGKGRMIRHTFTSARTCEVRLTVVDNEGKPDTQMHPVEVVKPNKFPFARFVFTPKGGEFPLSVTFDASASFDPDGEIAAYAWDFGDGVFGAGRTPAHTYTRAGTFPIKLKVTDNGGKTADKTGSITIIKPNDLPRADFAYSPPGGFYPLDILFDGTASVDPDGTIVSYAWDFGDGEASTSPKPFHRFKLWGTYTVKLTVVDDRSGVAHSSKSIVVLRLFQPLNIRWTTSVDEGLFTRRYVTDIAWDSNPENDRIGRIVYYRVFRKPAGAALTVFAPLVLVDGTARAYRDSDAGPAGTYEYTVTAIDDRGHESPILR